RAGGGAGLRRRRAARAGDRGRAAGRPGAPEPGRQRRVGAGLGGGSVRVVGLVVAWRRPANPLGWIMLGGAFFGALSEDASFYTVADYRLRHGGLPFGWLALLAQPGWAPAVMLFGL